jgi:AcrR family transcriptional regulator
MDEKTKPSLRGESTRDALLDAATLVFARAGFGSANLREIAEAADVNPALIGYHFRSKEGLYLAVFERMVAQMRLELDPALAAIDQLLAEPEPPGAGPDRYLAPLLGFVEGMLTYFVTEHPSWGELFVREQHHPTQAFELLYEGVIGRGQRALVALVLKLRKGEDEDKARLIAVTIFSQLILVRLARTPLMRLMRWDAIRAPELEALKALLRRNTTLLVLGD